MCFDSKHLTCFDSKQLLVATTDGRPRYRTTGGPKCLLLLSLLKTPVNLTNPTSVCAGEQRFYCPLERWDYAGPPVVVQVQWMGGALRAPPRNFAD